MIYAEILFIKRAGADSRQKKTLIASEAEHLLAGDPTLSVCPENVERFMSTAYDLRKRGNSW